MSFHNVRFPEGISYGAVGGPKFNTTVIASDSGHEQRNINWARSRLRWNVTQGLKDETDVNELIEFFRARYGKAYGFRFKDWSDYQASSQPLAAVGSSTTDFQLRKQYTSGPSTYVREITHPVAGTVTVVDDSGPRLDVTVDTETGVIQLGTPAVGQVLATFEFDVPVRFDTDMMELNLEFFNLSNWENIEVVELRQ